MNFLNRQMFQDGGPSTPSVPLGANQIYDTVSGKFYNFDDNFINDLFLKGRNLYPILKDDTLLKGSNVAAALEKFRDQDEPFDLSKRSFGYLEPRDVGTGLVDAGIAAGKFVEPYVKKGIAGIGELVGSDYLKKADDDVGIGLLGFKRDEMDSIFPSDEERSRAALERITGERNFSAANINPNVTSGTNMFFDALRSGDEKVSDYFGTDRIFSEQPQQENIQDFQGDIDGFVGPAQPGVDVVDQAIVTESSGVTPRFESETLSLEGGPFDMETRRLEYQQEMIGRDEFGNLLPEGRLEQDDEISQLLEDIKPAEQKVDVDKTQADTLAEIDNKFGGLSQDEFRDELDKDLLPTMPSISGIPELQGQETLTKQGDPISRKLEQPGFFGSNRFLDFIRNVGGELTRTGDIAQGLGFGAAKAAEERAARELIEGQEERDYRMKLRLAKAEADLELRNLGVEGASDSMKKELRTVAQEVNADYNDIVSAKNTLEIVGQVEDIIMNKDTTSVKAITGEIFEKVGAFFNIDGEPEKSGKKWEDLEPRTRVKVLLNQIKQKNIRDILGESGKTISNLDRQIVDELVGSLKIGTTPQETLKALEMTKTSIFNNLSTSQNRLKTNFYFAEAEGGMYLIQDNSNIMQYLQTGNLPSRLYTSRYNDNSALKKITLEG